MASCPCCSHSMLRHIRHHEVYWFCRTCWADMPVLERKNNVLAVLAEDLAVYRQQNRPCPLLKALV